MTDSGKSDGKIDPSLDKLIDSDEPLSKEELEKLEAAMTLHEDHTNNQENHESNGILASSAPVRQHAQPYPGSTLGTNPPATLPSHMWAEADASTFKIRSSQYLHDKVKTLSDVGLFRLVATDILEFPTQTFNVCAHPRNRVAQAKARGEDFWAFVINYVVPGPPHLTYTMYFVGDKKLIDEDTPFGRIAKPFFYGDDDNYRNQRFKLIPKIIQGNSLIKMAVKDTPTLLGNKLRQLYFRDDHYFEIDVDVSSSRIARNIVGLVIGYSKSIVVDIGVCLQGNDDNELPEVIMGAARCANVDMKLAPKV